MSDLLFMVVLIGFAIYVRSRIVNLTLIFAAIPWVISIVSSIAFWPLIYLVVPAFLPLMAYDWIGQNSLSTSVVYTILVALPAATLWFNEKKGRAFVMHIASTFIASFLVHNIMNISNVGIGLSTP